MELENRVKCLEAALQLTLLSLDQVILAGKQMSKEQTDAELREITLTGRVTALEKRLEALENAR